MAPDPTQFDDSLPDGLTKDLVALFPPVRVPPAVEAAILANVGRQSARVRRMRVLLRWGGGAAAAAAVLLVSVHLWTAGRPQAYHPSARVTILDAFSLARQLKAGGKIDASWDVNHDGRVDQRDVDALASRAVSLSAGGTQ
jgi:hypothetical protein